ncbi:MAG TPA: hypothetical protein VHI10_18290 [Mycobacterium sp.]|nr:hypothetical protein [Mycobacterium sp.]
MPLDAGMVSRWFDYYLETFAACVRGDQAMAALLRHYGVPLIITSDDGVIEVMTDDEAAAIMQSLVDGLRALGFHHIQVLHPEVTILNAMSAIYRATMSRRNQHGDEIGCPTITYVVTEDVAGIRIKVLATRGQ